MSADPAEAAGSAAIRPAAGLSANHLLLPTYKELQQQQQNLSLAILVRNFAFIWFVAALHLFAI